MITLICKRSLIVLLISLFYCNMLSAQEKVIYPSLKYPDFPFSEAVAYGGILYLSGDLGTGADGELVEGGIGPESKQLMENLKQKLARHKLAMSDLIKCTVFLTDMNEWARFNETYVKYFEKGRYPARSAVGASGLALGARVEIECNAAMQQ